ncbi:hypothetical protein [Salegentibacter chungangensis]|uniref:Uncharacterized protein n=1 Tax=Salegentibacter chungangensis TaxID=1335724 RepID=A0ABW3NPZ6_9FLAO
MSSYLNTQEIKRSLQVLVKQYVEECVNCQELPQDFIDLIKHNFLAKFVYYNKAKKQIEIGIEDQESDAPYPEIKTYSFPVDKAANWLDQSFRNDDCDLKFYGKLLNRNELISSGDVVLIN